MFETLVYKGFSSLSFFRRFCNFCSSIGHDYPFTPKRCVNTQKPCACLASTIILVAFQVVCQCLYRALGPTRRLIGSTVSSKLYRDRDEGILCHVHVTVTVHEIPTKFPLCHGTVPLHLNRDHNLRVGRLAQIASQ